MTGDSSEPGKSSTGDRPKVSVVTAAFNALDGVRATVESVASQGGVSVEHIVIDGGSSDGTVEYLSEPDSRVVWISEPDDGIADAMNKGVERARGEYVIVLQAGDTFVGSDSLVRVLPYLDGRDMILADVAFGKENRLVTSPRPMRRLFFKPICHQGLLVRRDIFEKLGGFDGSYRVTMDYDFCLRARNAGFRMDHVPHLLSWMDDDGLSSQTDLPALLRRFSEERRTQLANCPHAVARLGYALYWPAYLFYRRLRAHW